MTHVEHVTSIIKLELKPQCYSQVWIDHNDAYILLNGTMTITGGPDDAIEANKRVDERKKEVIFTGHHLLNAEVK